MTFQNSKKTLLPHKICDSHIRLLRIYKTVIESGGFASAEIELNISKPAISIAISELESLLNMRLCHRGRAGFSITKKGEIVYQSTLQLLNSLETFKLQVNEINRELKGEFNIGITDNLVTIPKMYTTSALSALKMRGPEVKINIHMIPPNDIESGVIDGQLHVGVVPDLRKLTGLNYIPLYKEKSLLYCSKDHPLFDTKDSNLSLNKLEKFDAVLPAYPQVKEIKQQQKKLKATATSNDREGIVFLILTGHYIGFLPTHYAAQWVKEGMLSAIQPDHHSFITHYSTITQKSARSNLILETYIEELNKHCKIS